MVQTGLEITAEMIEVGRRILRRYDPLAGEDCETVVDIFTAMLAARQPCQAQSRDDRSGSTSFEGAGEAPDHGHR